MELTIRRLGHDLVDDAPVRVVADPVGDMLAELFPLASLGGIVVSDGAATVAWSALLGFSDASALILGLSLPPLLCRPADVARTSAGMFTLSYGGAVLIAIISGALWDVSGLPALSFAPLAVCAIALAGVALRMRQCHELV